ncbi:MAG: MlaD family protein [Gemmatimonadaceae bacterium]
MKRRDEVLVGVLLTVAIAIAAVGTIWLTRGGLSSGYPLHARFKWGAGLRQGQPVALAGFSVGYVDAVQLRDDGWLDVTLQIEKGRRIPTNASARVEAVGFFGDRQVALTPTGPSATHYMPNDTVPTGRAEPSTTELLQRLDSVTRTVVGVTDEIQLQLVKQGGISDLRRTLASTNQLVNQLNALALEQSRELSRTQATLRRTVAAVDSATIDSTVKNLRKASASFTVISANLEATTQQLSSVLSKIEKGDGTAGRLLNDPQLYNDVHSLVARIDSLTADFKAHPRKYINLKIF